jgi:hypothetical protein
MNEVRQPQQGSVKARMITAMMICFITGGLFSRLFIFPE